MKKILQYILLIPFTFNFFNFTIEQLSSMIHINPTTEILRDSSNPITSNTIIDTKTEQSILKITFSYKVDENTENIVDQLIYHHCTLLLESSKNPKNLFFIFYRFFNSSSKKFKLEKQKIIKLLNKPMVSQSELSLIFHKLTWSFYADTDKLYFDIYRIEKDFFFHYINKDFDKRELIVDKIKNFCINVFNENIYFVHKPRKTIISKKIHTQHTRAYISSFQKLYNQKKMKITRIINSIFQDIINEKYMLSNETQDNLQDFFQSIYIFLDFKIYKNIPKTVNSILPIIENFLKVFNGNIDQQKGVEQLNLEEFKQNIQLRHNMFPLEFLKKINDIMIILFKFFLFKTTNLFFYRIENLHQN